MKKLMALSLLTAATLSLVALQPSADAKTVSGKMPMDSQMATGHKQDIVDTAISAGPFDTLAKALTSAGLADTLKGKGPYTVFAPTDAAFAKLPAGTLENLMKPENKEKLREILLYHVVSGNATSRDAAKMKTAKTVEGASVQFSKKAGTLEVNNAKIVRADIKTTNGTIHAIDTVLMPPTK